MSWIVKVTLLGLALVLLLLPFVANLQYSAYLSFNSTLQLINGTSSDLQKLLRYFNSTATVPFFRIPSLLFEQSCWQ